MNQGEKTLHCTAAAGKYIAPAVKVSDLKSRRIICQSVGNNPSLKEDEDDWS